MRFLHNSFFGAPDFSVSSTDRATFLQPVSSSHVSSTSVLSQSIDPGDLTFSALHTASCCSCGQNHQTLKLFLAQAEQDGSGTVSGEVSAGTYAGGGDVPGDTSTSETLTVGDSVVDTIEISGDQDWFEVTLEAGQRYVFTLTGTGGDPLDDPYLELMNASGNQVAFNDDFGGGYDSTLYFTASTSGTYYLNAHGWADSGGNTSTGQYTLTFDEAPPIGEYTFDEIANFITQEYWHPVRWGKTDLTYDVSGLSAGAQALALQALAMWADLTNLTFTEDTENPDISFQNTEDGAFTNFSYSGTDGDGYYIMASATVNVSTDWFGGDLTLDSYTFQTFLHEIGHALGLGHSGPYNSTATYGVDNIYINDNWSYSLMSYFDQAESGFGSYRFALGPQVADIIAIQDLYAPDPDGTRTGDTVYGFNSTESDVNDWSQFVVIETEGTYLRPPSMAIYDTDGTDTIDLSGFSRNQYLSLVPETFSSLGDRPIDGAPTYINNISIARGTIIENAVGGSGSDTIIGNDVANSLSGGRGDDLLYGGNGDDTLYGNNNNDHLYGENGNDFLYGGYNTDILDGGNGIDYLYGQDGNDTLNGGKGDDQLFGGDGNDTLYGNNNNDQMFGENGNDRLYGGYNEDHLYGGSGNDYLSGQRGSDVLYGGDGDDTLYGNNDSDQLYGENGNDRLYGGYNPDILDGGDGNDTLYGQGGNDTLTGAKGDDLLYGGDGDDTLYGNNHNDLLYGEAGNDHLYGGYNTDVLDGGSGNDTLSGGGGDDTFVMSDYTSGTLDEILDFESGTDVIRFVGSGFTNYSQVQGAMSSDGNGNTIITFASGAQLQIDGMAPGDFTSGDFELVAAAEVQSGKSAAVFEASETGQPADTFDFSSLPGINPMTAKAAAVTVMEVFSMSDAQISDGSSAFGFEGIHLYSALADADPFYLDHAVIDTWDHIS